VPGEAVATTHDGTSIAVTGVHWLSLGGVPFLVRSVGGEDATDVNFPPVIDPSYTYFGVLSRGELEQVQFLLGHSSVQTTERYIGYRQKFKDAVNDCFQISPTSRA
jgi:hypothetical protein